MINIDYILIYYKRQQAKASNCYTRFRSSTKRRNYQKEKNKVQILEINIKSPSSSSVREHSYFWHQIIIFFTRIQIQNRVLFFGIFFKNTHTYNLTNNQNKNPGPLCFKALLSTYKMILLLTFKCLISRAKHLITFIFFLNFTNWTNLKEIQSLKLIMYAMVRSPFSFDESLHLISDKINYQKI